MAQCPPPYASSGEHSQLLRGEFGSFNWKVRSYAAISEYRDKDGRWKSTENK